MMRTPGLTLIGVFLVSVAFPHFATMCAQEVDDVEASVVRMAKIGACSSPSFSPDGQQIAFVCNMSGLPQVWTVSSDGGWPTQVTALDDQVGGVKWSPDGQWLAFALAPGGGMNQQIYLVRPDGSDMQRLTDGGKDNNWLGEWGPDGNLLTLASSRHNPGVVAPHVYDLARNELRLIKDLPGINVITEFSPDKESVIVARMESRGNNNLVLLDVANGDERLLTPHEGPGSFNGGKFADDNTIYLSSNADRDLIAFAKIQLDKKGIPGPIEIVAEREDAELASFELAPDNQSAALLWNVAGRTELEFVDLNTMVREPGPALPAEIGGGLTFSSDGNLLAMVVSGSSSPSDIWVLDRRNQQLTQVTYSPHAGVDLSSLIQPELVQFEAHDGVTLSGWLYLALDREGPGPIVLSFHGGPEGQERPRFRSDYQALLSQGISVFAPNVRGSSGFGKRFVNLDNGPLRVDGVKDITACVDYVVDAGVADPNRIGIMGGSYGGYMTMAGLTEYPDMFAAGANLFGVVNFETFFAQTEPWMAAISTVEYGDPETQREMLRNLSPIHKVDRVTAPTIVLHGANDTNVPVVEAEQVVDSLKQRGVPVEYVLFPDEGHGFRKTPNRVRSTVAIVDWFTRHLK
ncbi:MAG: prolyl oligopeptidase family serine peptidase [Pirellulaceae bacterium]